MNHDLRIFYSWVTRTREIVFEYTARLPEPVYTLERPDFAFGSIRNTHAHVAECYLKWVGQVGLGRPAPAINALEIADTAAMRGWFNKVDAVVEEALAAFAEPDRVHESTNASGWVERHSGRWLVMHPITHEFHHKGQMLALGRVLGYPHVLPSGQDTDLMQPLGA